MGRKQPKPKEPKPWERPPWPSKGDRSQRKLYEAIGRALSQWERYEGVLSLVFSNLVASDCPTIARRAYSAVRTFEGRSDMLSAASFAYFSEWPDEKLLIAFKGVLRAAKSFNLRRIDLAHGAVDYYFPNPRPATWRPGNSYALYPSYANFKDRDVKDVPSYCYTSRELENLRMEFHLLQKPALQLAQDLSRRRLQPSPSMYGQQSPQSTNRAAEKKHRQ